MSKIRSMRRYGFLASSIGVTSAAALALSPALPAAATAARPAAGTPAVVTEPAVTAAPAAVPGSTQSLPLAPLAQDRPGDRSLAAPDQGLYRAHVRHFSLVGVIWDDPGAVLHGSVQIRTRSTATGVWSDWQDVDTHNADHGADPGTAERATGQVRGATAPLWVGDSDGVDVHVRADTGDRDADGDAATGAEPEGGAGGDVEAAAGGGAGGDVEAAAGGGAGGDAASETEGDAGGGAAEPPAPLPDGLSLQLVDPGDDPPAAGAEPEQSRTGELTEAATAASAANAGLAPIGAAEIPELGREDTERELLDLRGDELTEDQRAEPHIGPRPRIVTRHGWGADESLRARGFAYTKKVKAVFVHHTATGNNYRCSQTPSVIRGVYRYHVKSMGWRDIGYNFLVDKCGTIYEGRAGGVAKAVLGAHTMGFNSDSMGVAVIGTYSRTKPAKAAVTAVARLAAWKLGLYGMNPRGKTYLKSGGGNLYQKGENVRLNVISGHRDGFATDCPGRQLYGKLGTVRSSAARYQGR
ncbi:peptidoglycan recognition protein [Streptomyces sp. NPDC018610]|uniref:peptidoglycan recognition protein n=1 Tax=Streptomyces sp. NPDC018610 TaxID=3365049 RepID=UPI0037A4A66E